LITPVATRAGRKSRRVIGCLRAEVPGPTLVVVGSIHGNEPAGAAALESVVSRIGEERLLRRGELLALTGNVTALERGLRFVDEDLNRNWSADAVARQQGLSAEDEERRALDEEIRGGFARARSEIVFLDLHTTSGDGKPFAVFPDTLRSRSFARRFPLPAILGFEEQLGGALIDHVGLLGHVAVAFEGGQHSDPASCANLAAVVWIALGELDMVEASRVGIDRERERLSRAAAGVPRILEVTYRHAITAEDGFRMRSGHRSFEPVLRGQVVADDLGGEVAVPFSGFLLMPLYQKLGDDGFFVARRVRRVWLTVSAILRTLRAGRIVHWLPGVSRVAGVPSSFRVDRKVARWYTLEVLHLLGFRRVSQDGDVLTVERRAHDLV
jgi:succinylglutamate desuccinylase